MLIFLSTILLTTHTALMRDSDELQVVYDWEANYHKCFDNSFSLAVPSGVDTRDMSIVQAGDGQTVSQANGSLVVTSGTIPNAETIIRSNDCFTRELLANLIAQRSQAIANTRLVLQLVDVIGDGLSLAVDSSAQVTIRVPKINPYYAKFKRVLGVSPVAMAGMKMSIGAVGAVPGAIPGRYGIASATYDEENVSIVFTVSGWAAGSQGVCSLYGWNFIETYFSGTSTYSANFDSGRNGYNSNVGFAAYGASSFPNTTAAVCYNIHKTSEQIMFSYNQITSSAASTLLATRLTGIPSEETKLYLQLIVRNETAAPASNTNFTFLGVRIEEMNAQTVQINGLKLPNSTGGVFSLPVTLTSSAVSVSSLAMSATSSGVSTRYRLISAATTNLSLIKNTSGVINGGTITNTGDGIAYLKFYNKASAPVLATDVPVYTVPLLPKSTLDVNALTGTVGDRFATGIAIAVTGGYADNDATAVAAEPPGQRITGTRMRRSASSTSTRKPRSSESGEPGS